jgi:biotin carboxyl carrier protein
MKIEEMEQLVQLLRESNVGELTLRQEGERVTIRKSATSAAPYFVEDRDEDEYGFEGGYAEPSDDEDENADDVHTRSVLVTAPLVGVFAHVKPLIGLNARVTEGQVVGIIEAMKLVTEIKAPATGTVVDLFIEAGHPVEFGQALFEIRAD